MRDPHYRHFVAVLERCADGLATQADVQDAAEAVIKLHRLNDNLEDPLFLALIAASYPSDVGMHEIPLPDSLSDAACPALGTPGGFAVVAQEKAAECCLLRDIYGNPFRRCSLDPAWLTPTVRDLARGIYDERAFDRLAILADALEEADCTNDDILGHLRGPGPHVRGCWVVDLLLGKA
jgi:hypothetical protein